jgi:hypothetical protein
MKLRVWLVIWQKNEGFVAPAVSTSRSTLDIRAGLNVLSVTGKIALSKRKKKKPSAEHSARPEHNWQRFRNKSKKREPMSIGDGVNFKPRQLGGQNCSGFLRMICWFN